LLPMISNLDAKERDAVAGPARALLSHDQKLSNEKVAA
jgi:hypothetical protein